MEGNSNIKLIITYRGKSAELLVSSSSTVTFCHFGLTHEGVEISTQKLIMHGHNIAISSNNTRSLTEVGLIDNEKLMLVGSSAQEVEFVKSNRPDPLVMGFDEEERREKRRRAKVTYDSKNNPYISNYEVLDEFTTPPPSAAMNLLKKLATDPGIIAVMKNHNWRVGTLKEMRPEGLVGISEVCILGLNTNKGQSISLRLRTDNKKGFRHFSTIKEVMLHELTHNEFSEHDERFWHLFRQLKKEADAWDWTKSQGHQIGRKETFDNNDYMSDENEDDGEILGGDSSVHSHLSMREIQEQAALKRLKEKEVENSQEPTPMEVSIEKSQLEQEIVKGEEVVHKQLQDVPAKKIEEQTPKHSPNISDTLPSPTPKTWSCKACTLENSLENSRCDACGTPKALDVQSLRSLETPMSRDEINQTIGEDQSLGVIQDSVSVAVSKIEGAIDKLVSSLAMEESLGALQTLDVILKNILEHPNDPKYRAVSLSSKLYQEKIGKHSGGLEVMKSVGFEEEKDSNKIQLKRNDLGFLWLARSTVQSRLKAFLPNQ